MTQDERRPDPSGTLAVQGVSHRYGDRQVLAEVDLEVGAGRAVALTGPNGAGKSTLLRIATGRELPSHGRVTWEGQALDVDDVRARRDMAVLLSAPSCYPDLTVRQHLELVAVAHGVADQDQVEQALVDWFLDDHAENLPQQLSSGLRQRLALASVAVRPARLVVMDEPEQHLDVATRRALGEWLAARVGVGCAVLLASHDEDLVAASGATVVALEAGV